MINTDLLIIDWPKKKQQQQNSYPLINEFGGEKQNKKYCSLDHSKKPKNQKKKR